MEEQDNIARHIGIGDQAWCQMELGEKAWRLVIELLAEQKNVEVSYEIYKKSDKNGKDQGNGTA